MKTFEKIFKYTIALEDSFKGVNYKLIHSNDPIISLCGGACTFNNSDLIVYKAKKFLDNDNDLEKSRTNNPTLIDECKQIKESPLEIPIIIFHNDLIKVLTADEQKAILYHEIGHIHHEHVKKSNEGTAGSFIEMELEADQYAVDQLGPKVMHSALEKCLTFGSKFSIITLKESSPTFIKKLLNVGIINKYMISSIYKMNKNVHDKRFKTLKQLEKQM